MGAVPCATSRFCCADLYLLHGTKHQCAGIPDLWVVGVLFDHFDFAHAKANTKYKSTHDAMDK